MSETFARPYVALWLITTLVAIGVAIRDRRAILLFRRAYWRWLLKPWKLATFAVAFTGMVVVAPYSGDPTWDHVTGGVQSVMTFLSAPWAVGTIYRRVRRIRPPSASELFCAAVAWLVSVSWFYDGYLRLRDGRYPDLWAENLFASSALYLLAGALWSTRPAPAGSGILGATFAFHLPDWPSAEEGNARRVLLLAALIMVFTTILMAPFLVEAWASLDAIPVSP